jgi:hypothetical protein
LDAEKVFDELKRKSELVDWNKNQRKEIFAIFAKSFAKKIEEDNLFLLIWKILHKFLTNEEYFN